MSSTTRILMGNWIKTQFTILRSCKGSKMSIGPTSISRTRWSLTQKWGGKWAFTTKRCRFHSIYKRRFIRIMEFCQSKSSRYLHRIIRIKWHLNLKTLSLMFILNIKAKLKSKKWTLNINLLSFVNSTLRIVIETFWLSIWSQLIMTQIS